MFSSTSGEKRKQHPEGESKEEFQQNKERHDPTSFPKSVSSVSFGSSFPPQEQQGLIDATTRNRENTEHSEDITEEQTANVKLEDARVLSEEDLPEEIIIESGDMPLVRPTQEFEPHEHTDIGNFAFHLFLKGLKDSNQEFYAHLLSKLTPKVLDNEEKAETYSPQAGKVIKIRLYEISLPSGLTVTPGEIVALAGDYIAIPEQPISFGSNLEEQEQRFSAAYQRLQNNDASAESIKKIVKRMRKEAVSKQPNHHHWNIRFLKQRLIDGVAPDLSNIQYGIDMAGSAKALFHSPYFKLGFNNFDHFQEEAKTAFLAGHRLAIKKAAQARVDSLLINDLEERKEYQTKLLHEALLIELFACHFLTDLFAGGHVRVPRKQLLNFISPPNESKASLEATPNLSQVSNFSLITAGFFARKMHDEDGKNGVYVRTSDPKGASWLAKGDGNYYNPENAKNAEKVCEAVQLALTDLVCAYQGMPTLLDQDLARYIPQEDVELNKRHDLHPLFSVKDNELHCRGDVLETVKEEGLVDGLQKSVPAVSASVGAYFCRLFTVKVKPAGEAAVTLAADKATEVYQRVARRVNCIVS